MLDFRVFQRVNYTQSENQCWRTMLPNGKPKIVDVRDLRKMFYLGDQWVPALRGVSFSITQGQFVAIMGPSGSGKSTLLYLLGGLDRPTEGQLVVGGSDLN